MEVRFNNIYVIKFQIKMYKKFLDVRRLLKFTIFAEENMRIAYTKFD